MKNFTLLVLSVVSLTLSVVATANPRAVNAAPVSLKAPEGSFRFGAGLSSYGTAGVGGIGGTEQPALSVMLDFNNVHSIQGLVGFASTSPFAFGAGAVYRARITGSRDNGFHVGLGFNLGTQGGAVGGGSSFFANIFPVGGFDFSLGGHVSNIHVSLDAGPVFAVTPNFQWAMKPITAGLLGLAIHYFF